MFFLLWSPFRDIPCASWTCLLVCEKRKKQINFCSIILKPPSRIISMKWNFPGCYICSNFYSGISVCILSNEHAFCVLVCKKEATTGKMIHGSKDDPTKDNPRWESAQNEKEKFWFRYHEIYVCIIRTMTFQGDLFVAVLILGSSCFSMGRATMLVRKKAQKWD